MTVSGSLDFLPVIVQREPGGRYTAVYVHASEFPNITSKRRILSLWQIAKASPAYQALYKS